jgi:hypothetical protein
VDVGVVDLDALDLDLAVLAEQMDLVPQEGQGTGEIRGVDVAAGAAQHVAMKEKHAHSAGEAISVPGRELEAALQDAGAGLGP